VINIIEKRCKLCGVKIERIRDKRKIVDEDEEFIAGYCNNEITLCLKGRAKIWETVFLVHEFCHYLWENFYIYKYNKPVKGKEYNNNTFFIEIQVEVLTLKLLRELKANKRIIDFCKKSIISNLKEYL